MRRSATHASRSIGIVAITLGVAACATERAHESTCVGDRAALPSWATPSGSETASRVPTPPMSAGDARESRSRDVVRIIPEAEHDAVTDVILAANGRERLHALSMRETPAVEALRMLAVVGRFNVVFPSDLDARRVTLHLRGVRVVDAFASVLEVTNLDASVVSGNVIAIHAAPANGSVAGR
jgi:hypothetical protein